MGRPRGDETGIPRKRLIRARQLAGLDRGQLADRLEIDRTYVYRVEEGNRRPSLEMMERWAKLLDVPLDIFRTESESSEAAA